MMHKYSQDFLAQYKNQQPKWGPLGFITYKRTYSRFIEETGRNEEWWQTCWRVLEGNFNIIPNDPSVTQEEMELAYHLMFHMAWTPPGRGLWISGTPTSFRVGSSLVNCWAIATHTHNDKVSFPFRFMFDNLMLGGGVGANVSLDYVANMPKVSTRVNLFVYCSEEHRDWDRFPTIVTSCMPNTYDIFYKVEDSREGWVSALGTVVDAHYQTQPNATVVIDISDVRPYGEPIRGFGGVSSGPEPLVVLLEDVNKLLNGCVGRKISSVEAVDIYNMIGKATVAGNVRRSAQLMAGDFDDHDFVVMKQDQEKLYHHRWASNNSVIVDPFTDDFTDVAESIKYNGEPGLLFLYNARHYGRMIDGFQKDIDGKVITTNPCVTGDTWVMTKEGPRKAIELLGKSCDVLVEGKYYPSNTGTFFTGCKKVYEIETDRGYRIKATANHPILTANYEWKKVEDLSVGDKIKLSNQRGVEPWGGPGSFDDGWLLGELIGNGGFGETYNGYVRFWRGSQNEMAAQAEEYMRNSLCSRSDLTGINKCTTVMSRRLSDLAIRFGIQPGKLIDSKIERTSYDFHRGFICGIFDAYGSVQGNRAKGVSIRLSQSNVENLMLVQRMLSRLGIVSTIYKNRQEEKAKAMPNGRGGYKEYSCKAHQCELVISRDNMKVFFDLIGFREPAKRKKLKDALDSYSRPLYKEKFEATIVSIKEQDIEEVYDINVGEVHEFDANGIRVHNCGEIFLESGEPCNLAEVFPYRCMELGVDVHDVLRIALRYTKRVTFAKYHWGISEEVIKRNRRVGVSLSGIQDWLLAKFGNPIVGYETKLVDGIELKIPKINDAIKYELDKMYKTVVEADKEISKQLGCNESIKRTTVKPSGSVAMLPGASPGIHYHYSDYYIRRIRFQEKDPLLDVLRYAGYRMEDDAYSPNTKVVEFPVKVPTAGFENFMSAEDITIEHQFAMLELMQTYWADNSVSITVTFHPETEGHKIAPLLKYYRNTIKSVSLLPYSGHNYKQAPYEPISEEEYIKRRGELLGEPHEFMYLIGDGSTSEDAIDECVGGACPIR